ncbi:MAG: hypothetical protein M1830_008101 [Pleopsidium flavum]|nr:MAG: hypothetical protein M1830_008101 [Pleopsidium flavum]
MATSIEPNGFVEDHRTKRSVLQSMMAPRSHKRNPSAGLVLSSTRTENTNPNGRDPSNVLPSNPSNRPHPSQPLGEVSKNRERARSSPRKPAGPGRDVSHDDGKSMHKKTKSSVSLKSLVGGDKASKPSTQQIPLEMKPKKSKSSTSLSALLSRSKSSNGHKHETSRGWKDKENQTPPSSAGSDPPPIWAQCASQPLQGTSNTTRVCLNDRRSVDEEMALYTPKEYSPSKQRNFCDYNQPTLAKRPEAKARPKSAYLPSAPSMASITDTLSGRRKVSQDRIIQPAPGRDFMKANRISSDEKRRASSEQDVISRRSSVEDRRTSNGSFKEGLTMAKRGARVMAAVAAFNGKSKEQEKDVKVDVKMINSAFEALLDSRNVPQNMRDRMRSLDTNIKADFIKQNKVESGSVTSTAASSTTPWNADTEKRPSVQERSQTDNAGQGGLGENANSVSPKKARPRSRTFTLSKSSDSPSKKHKSEFNATHGRVKSIDSTQSGPSKSLTSSGAAQAIAFLGKGPKPAAPEDFISYLRKTQKPEHVEVGKLHKLRLLLRNETVAWVDSFITKGGMAELVGLLHRIIEVEWREEHEDTLLHEALLCLKALCTTGLALERLADIKATLFPALLGMLFDEEKKGPSEFSTRGIVMSLLFSHLSTCSPSLLVSRTDTILSYLRDPAPPEEAQPVGFIASIYQPRPYRVWCKEIVNVTKEVFWIFLHHLNVVPITPTPTPSATHDYARLHFPRERPPVPAAPYVGGVEWEATNYLAAHLDLMNALIASLPTREERNRLRQELKVSGFEKCMGGSLRTCKEKFYGAVHDGLRTWVSAALEDGWDVRDVRNGPPREEVKYKTSPKKSKKEEPPKIEMPMLELSVGVEPGQGVYGGWL